MRLWLTSMCGPGNGDNAREMVEPIREYLDGIVWVLNDCPRDDSVALYLDAEKGAGMIIHRPWPKGRHHVAMNDTLYCGPIEEGDLVLWCDALERPRASFVSRVKTEIAALMAEADMDVIAFYGKPFLLRYRETMEYRGSPHWYLTGSNGRAMEWSTIEPDETKVRFNARPSKRISEHHWVGHYLGYYVAYPAGSNHCLLGLEKQGDTNVLFPIREERRLAFRRYLRAQGVPCTVEGVKGWMESTPDETGKAFIRTEKILNDAWRYWVLGDRTLVDNHDHHDMVRVE